MMADCNKFCMLEKVKFLKNNGNLTKPSNRMVADHDVVMAMMAVLVCTSIFPGRGNGVLAVEIVMGPKYCFAFFWPVETGMFFMNARFNATISPLN